ncbi:MAG: protein kinase [Gammaproteobacteria bacterium]|nr:protein kinase [Gammaproteobacteria bacterium]
MALSYTELPASAVRGGRLVGFGLKTGERIGDKYTVLGLLGRGWEGEVYGIRENRTGIERAAKLFFPHRNPRNRAAIRYAKKLHRLRHCPILVQFHTQEDISFHGFPVNMLVSEYVQGDPLSVFLARQPGRRLSPFAALHLLYALARGVEPIHHARDYHGDIHQDNLMIQRYGIGFDIKLLDLYQWSGPVQENIREDVCDMVRIFYDAMGGKARYSGLPKQIKEICCGLRKTLITRKFRNAGQLRAHLESIEWES